MRTVIKTSISSFLVSVLLAFSPAIAADSSFKTHNPDGNKYEFGRAYISALGYFYASDQRWIKMPPKKKFKGDDNKIILGTMEYLVQDNADLRVAKNYMVRYLGMPNPLMRKVADMMIVVCDNEINLNNKAKFLWQDWLNLKALGKPSSDQEKLFIKAQREVEVKRKDYDKQLIQATVLMTKVLLSQENADDKGHLLAITDKERDRLQGYLDRYGKEMLDWGLKPGQTALKASVSVIREVLEDPVFTTRK